jgi:hypothetical protein
MCSDYTNSCLLYALSNRQPWKNVSCFCLDMAQWRLLIGQSLCNAIYWSNMGFSVYWCSRWNGHIEYIGTTAFGVLTFGPGSWNLNPTLCTCLLYMVGLCCLPSLRHEISTQPLYMFAVHGGVVLFTFSRTICLSCVVILLVLTDYILAPPSWVLVSQHKPSGLIP